MRLVPKSPSTEVSTKTEEEMREEDPAEGDAVVQGVTKSGNSWQMIWRWK